MANTIQHQFQRGQGETQLSLRLSQCVGILPNLIYGVNMNLSIEQLTSINDNLSSLWEIVAYADDLSKEEIIKHLKVNLHQLDDIFKCVES
jgi:hypothetical protein